MGKFKVKNLIKSQFQHLISEENEVLNISKKSHYTNSFGYQWSIFDKAQLDSKTGINWSQDRFRCTNWTDEEIYEKVVLEIGSGAGRFTEILLKKKAKKYKLTPCLPKPSLLVLRGTDAFAKTPISIFAITSISLI